MNIPDESPIGDVSICENDELVGYAVEHSSNGMSHTLRNTSVVGLNKTLVP